MGIPSTRIMSSGSRSCHCRRKLFKNDFVALISWIGRVTLKERRLYHCHFLVAAAWFLFSQVLGPFWPPSLLHVIWRYWYKTNWCTFTYQEFMESLSPYLINHHRLGILFYHSWIETFCIQNTFQFQPPWYFIWKSSCILALSRTATRFSLERWARGTGRAKSFPESSTHYETTTKLPKAHLTMMTHTW